MTNTVLLSGKGFFAYVLFMQLANRYEHAKLSIVKPKWWQSTHRYQLRIQNVGTEDIVALYAIKDQYPDTGQINIQVF